MSLPATSAASAMATGRSRPAPTVLRRSRSFTTCSTPRASSPATPLRVARPASGAMRGFCRCRRVSSPTSPSASPRWSTPTAWALASEPPICTSRTMRFAFPRSASRTASSRWRWPTRASSDLTRSVAHPRATWRTRLPRRRPGSASRPASWCPPISNLPRFSIRWSTARASSASTATTTTSTVSRR